MFSSHRIDVAFAMPAFASLTVPATSWLGANHRFVSPNAANFANYTTQKFTGYGYRGVWNSID